MMYEPNAPITLAETKIAFEVHGGVVEMPAKAILRLLPDPALVIECKDNLTAENIFLTDVKNKYITAPILGLKTDFIIQCSWGMGCKDSYINLICFPKEQPVLARETEEELSSVEFGVLNFPEFFHFSKRFQSQDNRIEVNGMVSRQGAVQLLADPWVINITAAPNLSNAVKVLNTDGGYAITNMGTISRTDGSNFSVQEAESLIDGLWYFLSFARGAFCGLTLIKGKDPSGELAWEQWGSRRVTPHGNPSSWFVSRHGQILSQVFPGFWKLYQNEEEMVRRVVRFYLESNLMKSIDTGIIFTHAALETLSHKTAGKKLGECIANALKENGILRAALEISPMSCPDLAGLACKHRWAHGPHAVVEIRNNVIHPKSKYSDISQRAFHEAWNLGQWYIELMLLAKSGYGGDYSNRVTRENRDDVETLGDWLDESRA